MLLYLSICVGQGCRTPSLTNIQSWQVMCEYVRSQNLTVVQAMKTVQDILFNTSNRIYQLNLPLESINPPIFTPNKQPVVSEATAPIEGLDKLHNLITEEPSLIFLRLQWVDFTATVRVKILTLRHAIHLFSQGKGISIPKAALSLVQLDALVDNVPPVGQLEVYPIFSSLRLAARPGYAMVQCELRDDDGEPVDICPRTFLRKQVELAQSESVCFLVGFEIEVVFLDAGPTDNLSVSSRPQVTQGQCWSSLRALHESKMMDLLEAIVASLERSGIDIQQFHAESGAGQYEFVMDPMEPLAAVDALICARDTIMTIASKYGMRATMVPKAFSAAPSTGAHAHISVEPVKKHEHFLAGILRELRPIMAITCPNPASYERLVDSVWSGGESGLFPIETRDSHAHHRNMGSLGYRKPRNPHPTHQRHLRSALRNQMHGRLRKPLSRTWCDPWQRILWHQMAAAFRRRRLYRRPRKNGFGGEARLGH